MEVSTFPGIWAPLRSLFIEGGGARMWEGLISGTLQYLPPSLVLTVSIVVWGPLPIAVLANTEQL